MKKVRIFYNKKSNTIRVKAEHDLQWYDSIKKEMQIFRGGKLDFVYQKDNYLEEQGHKNPYRLLPKVIDVFTTSIEQVDDKKDVQKFYADYLNYNNSDITIDEDNTTDIVFLVPDKEINDFLYDLDNHTIRYSVD